MGPCITSHAHRHVRAVDRLLLAKKHTSVLRPDQSLSDDSLDNEALIAESDGTPTGIGNDGVLRS